ncbi:MAG TPA: hypothetical protein VI564_06480, partial [Candidatus Nanoarchaeia archaeon]|nr:hypothetical protein [Candidatus Nanoarchaeia archaeon]
VMISTALHSIAAGNMLPSFYEKNGKIFPLSIIAVDQDEFVLSKLIDRGTSNFYGIVANSRDFLKILVNELKQK